jgi:hypothetical protein
VVATGGLEVAGGATDGEPAPDATVTGGEPAPDATVTGGEPAPDATVTGGATDVGGELGGLVAGVQNRVGSGPNCTPVPWASGGSWTIHPGSSVSGLVSVLPSGSGLLTLRAKISLPTPTPNDWAA